MGCGVALHAPCFGYIWTLVWASIQTRTPIPRSPKALQEPSPSPLERIAPKTRFDQQARQNGIFNGQPSACTWVAYADTENIIQNKSNKTALLEKMKHTIYQGFRGP